MGIDLTNDFFYDLSHHYDIVYSLDDWIIGTYSAYTWLWTCHTRV